MLVHIAAGSTDGNTVTTPAISTTGANGIVLFVAGNGILDTDVTDSAGNTWTGHNQGGVSASGISFDIYPSSVGATMSATHTVTVTHTASKPSVIMVAFDGETSWDMFVTGTANTGLTSMQSLSYTANQPNELVFAGLITLQAKSALSIDTGFTIIENVNASSTATGAAAAFLIQTSIVTVQPTWSWTTAVTANALQTGFIGTFSPSTPSAAHRLTTLGAGLLMPRVGLLPGALAYGAKRLIDNPRLSRRGFIKGWRP